MQVKPCLILPWQDPSCICDGKLGLLGVGEPCACGDNVAAEPRNSTRAVMFLTSDNISSGAIVVVGLDLGAEPLRGSCNVAARSSPFLAELKIFILEQWPKESGKGPEKRWLWDQVVSACSDCLKNMFLNAPANSRSADNPMTCERWLAQRWTKGQEQQY
ncbi:hypothetical protein Bca101_033337 [Brassica carinata]